MAGLSLLTSAATNIFGLRRFGSAFLSKRLREEDEKIAEKKHPERKKYITNVITKRRTLKKEQFEKKFPTKAQRKVIKGKKKQAKKDFKQTKKIQKERYKTDPLYRASTVPRQQMSDTTMTWASYNPLLPGFRRGLRKEVKYGNNPISKRASWGILKKLSTFVESGQNLHKNFTPKGRKWLKKRKQEDATARSILSGDV
tara:strand:+ start:292 stop:888 length:597 start_codon:yes stop_codon:yes gene_type:complete